MSLIRQNYHPETENAFNKLINLTLTTEYAYIAMAYYYDRDDINLPNMMKFLKHCAEEKRETLEALLKMQNTRGGRIVFEDIAQPEKSEFGTCLNTITIALALERQYNQAALDLHAISDKHSDSQLSDWIEGQLLAESVEIIKKLGDYTAQLKRVGGGLGEYQFDQLTLKD